MTTEETEKAIVAAYDRGDLILDIENNLGVTRSMIYWTLDKYHRSPDRAKRRARITKGDEKVIASLYELIRHQDKRIQELEAELARLRPQPASNST